MKLNIPPSPGPAPEREGGTWPAWRPLPRPEEARQSANSARRRLRRQGAVRSLVGLLVAALLALWKPLFAVVVAAIALAFGVVALAAPGTYARIAAGLERFGYWLGSALTWILMPLIFFLLFLPVGLWLRMRGRLRITRGPDASLDTYWERPQPGQEWGVAPYRRQF